MRYIEGKTGITRLKVSMLTKNLTMLLAILGVSACASSTEFGAFDLEADRTGAVDKKGFPVVLGEQYNRDVPLKRTIERARLESELQAIAESRKNNKIDVKSRQSEILAQRLQQIARTHGDRARAQIAAACRTDDNGVVTCRGDAQQ